MKQTYLALSLACVMAVVLTGCSANRENDRVDPTHSAVSDYDDRASSGMNDGAYYSDNVGGASDHSPGMGDGPSASRGVIDDIGDAAGDLVEGAGDAVHDAGDAIGDAANDVGRAMR